ncbi:MAG: type I-B CRISPR-associated endonuclease Cas1 [Candidatus Aenigmarchaeota archaeon]|nr:type I-B CRISPR-associated endonuclease Cas1 [Candidatus Aenigmarchaeota archaeon]
MEKNYYILKSGRLKRKQNTIYFENAEGKKAIPIHDINAIFAFGEIDVNSKLLVFLAKNKIAVHFFSYYGFYSGSFYPKEYLVSGFLVVKQVQHYLEKEKRIGLAKEFVKCAAYNILQNLAYYNRQGKDVGDAIAKITYEAQCIDSIQEIPELMGIEGRIRNAYYQSFDRILRPGFEFEKRTKRPPENMINCLVSFGNSLLYTICLSEIYHTQLNATVSFLHEPGERRFSLSLDISEIFKPIIVDRVIFNLINNRLIKEEHFDDKLNFCHLNEAGRRIFISEFDEKLKTTIKHKKLKRKVSYKTLIKLECYKIIKHLIEGQKYEGFRMWW